MTQQTTTSDPVRALAVDTDTKLAGLDAAFAKIQARRGHALSSIHRYAGDKMQRVGRRQVWTMNDADAVEALRNRIEDGAVASWDLDAAQRAMATLFEQEAAADANRAAADALQDIHAAHGWSRYFSVKGGHIHSAISYYACSRTDTTEHGWHPELSGLTEADAVAALGPNLCTHCFPSAPVAWTIGTPKPARCPGSGQAPTVGTSRRTGMRVYGECSACGAPQLLNDTTRLVRAHKPK